MNKFMVTMSFPPFLTDEFVALIPRQRAMIVQLLSNGKLTNFSLNDQRSNAWMVINAKSEQEVEELLARFPLHDFFDYEIHTLVVHDTAFMGLPKVVLN
ncbi:MAG: muconolactone Delta-isomerase family protein [Bacteroidota bacterium]